DALSHGEFDKACKLLAAGGFTLLKDLEAILSTECVVLFPSALQDVIGTHNAPNLKCSYLVEGANNPTSREAQSRLHERGVIVIPDFIANPGGIIAAFVELTSKVSTEDNIKNRTKVEEAKTMTRTRIAANVSKMLDLAKTYGIEPADAGFYMALQNIFGKKS
ncbi:MAG: Glu/Leu/Phe/Val dehydrogenase, partial [Alphaproteobacteria bacterium]|nr:Glu/Leu/Phe/Val dehydrogenase [Alphaproteobacteria bacterium]